MYRDISSRRAYRNHAIFVVRVVLCISGQATSLNDKCLLIRHSNFLIGEISFVERSSSTTIFFSHFTNFFSASHKDLYRESSTTRSRSLSTPANFDSFVWALRSRRESRELNFAELNLRKEPAFAFSYYFSLHPGHRQHSGSSLTKSVSARGCQRLHQERTLLTFFMLSSFFHRFDNIAHIIIAHIERCYQLHFFSFRLSMFDYLRMLDIFASSMSHWRFVGTLSARYCFSRDVKFRFCFQVWKSFVAVRTRLRTVGSSCYRSRR